MSLTEWSGWVSGIGSLIAVAVALWYSQLQRRDLSHERLLSVHAWAERITGRTREWKLVVENRTAQPVYQWRCDLSWRSRSGSDDKGLHRESVGSSDLGIIPPGHHEFPWTPEEPPDNESAVSLNLFFRDARERTWKRSASGSISRVKLVGDEKAREANGP